MWTFEMTASVQRGSAVVEVLMLLLLAFLAGCVEGGKDAPADDTDGYSVVTADCGDAIDVDGAAVLEVYVCCGPDAVCSETTYTVAGTILTVECGEGCYASVALLDVGG